MPEQPVIAAQEWVVGNVRLDIQSGQMIGVISQRQHGNRQAEHSHRSNRQTQHRQRGQPIFQDGLADAGAALIIPDRSELWGPHGSCGREVENYRYLPNSGRLQAALPLHSCAGQAAAYRLIMVVCSVIPTVVTLTADVVLAWRG